MDDVLADDGNYDVVAGRSQPLLARVELHFHADGIGCKQCHEEHQDAWHEDRRQRVVV